MPQVSSSSPKPLKVLGLTVSLPILQDRQEVLSVAMALGRAVSTRRGHKRREGDAATPNVQFLVRGRGAIGMTIKVGLVGEGVTAVGASHV